MQVKFFLKISYIYSVQLKSSPYIGENGFFKSVSSNLFFNSVVLNYIVMTSCNVKYRRVVTVSVEKIKKKQQKNNNT